MDQKSAAVTVLDARTEPAIPGRMIDCRADIAQLTAAVEIPPGTAVQIEIGDRLLLGEVQASEPGPDGFVLGVRVSHSLNALSELQRLNRALLGEAPTARRDQTTLSLPCEK